MTITSSPPPRATGPARAAVAARRYAVRGVVQGVGFRPRVYTLARRYALAGTVCNTAGALVIEVEGGTAELDAFDAALLAEAPPLARISAVDMEEMAARGAAGFEIIESRRDGGYQPVSPDAATCANCLAELFDPGNRRHRYPFINCTECGPRFTIIEAMPYDRPLTTMRDFAMCARCAAEYGDPSDRRFHAQPNACADCGPRAWLAARDGTLIAGDAVVQAAAALHRGAIVAVKGLGGFQLAAVAGDAGAVRRLRARKHRPDKPFAVMVRDLQAARTLARAGPAEAALLSGSVRPIVLLRRRWDIAADVIAGAVAPGLHELGVMLPSTPLHHLLMAEAGVPLVMTSGNLSEEPICKDNDEAVERLGEVADLFLLHDRGIHARYDDSVIRVAAGAEQVVRRARGYCPLPIRVGETPAGAVLALGAHLKNTFCILRDGDAFVGPHIGDLDHPETLRHQDEALRTYLRLFHATPALVAADLHPDYASTRIAERWWEAGAAAVRVQHHHAHIASVMAEHGLRGPVIGVALDGTGHGEDGTIWGGELLLCDELGFERAGHLAPVAQPGGDRCARQGWRMAASYLVAAGLGGGPMPAAVASGPGAPDERAWRLVGRLAQAQGSAAAPVTTSAGRLFDAVASLLGVAQQSTYEAAAAMRLEALARRAEAGATALPVTRGGSPLVLDTVSLVAELAAERRAGRDAAELAAVFHQSLALALAQACADLAAASGVHRVALSGGVFQNALLLERTGELLRQRSLEVFVNRAVPANDGGISLGQALVAAARAGRDAGGWSS